MLRGQDLYSYLFPHYPEGRLRSPKGTHSSGRLCRISYFLLPTSYFLLLSFLLH